MQMGYPSGYIHVQLSYGALRPIRRKPRVAVSIEEPSHMEGGRGHGVNELHPEQVHRARENVSSEKPQH